MTAALAWSYREAEIGEDGLAETLSAGEGERAALAGALDILGCQALTATIEIKPAADRRFFRVSGAIEADVTQACGVTLEPVAAHLSEAFEAEFWPAGAAAPGDGDDIETIENGLIDVGRLVFEHVATALDPYPRKPGAQFHWTDPKAASSEAKTHPFAALERLKPKR